MSKTKTVKLTEGELELLGVILDLSIVDRKKALKKAVDKKQYELAQRIREGNAKVVALAKKVMA